MYSASGYTWFRCYWWATLTFFPFCIICPPNNYSFVLHLLCKRRLSFSFHLSVYAVLYTLYTLHHFHEFVSAFVDFILCSIILMEILWQDLQSVTAMWIFLVQFDLYGTVRYTLCRRGSQLIGVKSVARDHISVFRPIHNKTKRFWFIAFAKRRAQTRHGKINESKPYRIDCLFADSTFIAIEWFWCATSASSYSCN